MPTKFFHGVLGKKWEYIKGILTITLEFLTIHVDERGSTVTSSEITYTCVIPHRPYQAELLSRGKHKVKVPQLTEDL